MQLCESTRNTKMWALACLMATGLAMSACSSGDGGSGATAAPTTGQALVSLTDAAGDFLSYTVDVQSLTLARRDGTVVETLPVTTRVNFADYVEMTEFFTGATIPSGDYTAARMHLDYSTADLQVEDASGNAVAARPSIRRPVMSAPSLARSACCPLPPACEGASRATLRRSR